MEPSEVARVTEKLFELGCHEVSLGDTIGIGAPGATKTLVEAVEVIFLAVLIQRNAIFLRDFCLH